MLSRIVPLDGNTGFHRMTWGTAAAQSELGAPRSTVAREVTTEQNHSGLRAQLAEMERLAGQRIAEARDAAYREGRAAAEQQAAAAVQEALERLAAALTALTEERAKTIRAAECDLVNLAIEIARRVLHRELTIDVSALEALVKAAIEKLQTQEGAQLRVHPDHVEVVRSFLRRQGKAAQIEVTGDSGLEVGGVIFDLSSGKLDASVATQLQEIERGLIDRFQR